MARFSPDLSPDLTVDLSPNSGGGFDFVDGGTIVPTTTIDVDGMKVNVLDGDPDADLYTPSNDGDGRSGGANGASVSTVDNVTAGQGRVRDAINAAAMGRGEGNQLTTQQMADQLGVKPLSPFQQTIANLRGGLQSMLTGKPNPLAEQILRNPEFDELRTGTPELKAEVDRVLAEAEELSGRVDAHEAVEAWAAQRKAEVEVGSGTSGSSGSLRQRAGEIGLAFLIAGAELTGDQGMLRIAGAVGQSVGDLGAPVSAQASPQFDLSSHGEVRTPGEGFQGTGPDNPRYIYGDGDGGSVPIDGRSPGQSGLSPTDSEAPRQEGTQPGPKREYSDRPEPD
ncbi:hypothetical protein AB0B28_02585 [Glycomyces sp. NPDC046736]|uniref:hypothetical protein n=1 Tax=Glycomyces sp. NPDC046736 TaxID=3155615 RepID=UPI0033E74C41